MLYLLLQALVLVGAFRSTRAAPAESLQWLGSANDGCTGENVSVRREW